MRLTDRSELGVRLPPNLAGILHIFENSEKYRFRAQNSNCSRNAQKWDLTKCFCSQLVWDEKKRFVLKKVIFDFFGRFPMPDCIQRLIEDFEVFTVFSPYGSTTNLCLKSVENHQFFIFRKNGPKLATYFFLSKKTNFWRNLSSSEVSSLKTGLIPIYQLNVLERFGSRKFFKFANFLRGWEEIFRNLK